MAIIKVPGAQSGKQYSVRIAGEVPTDEEYSRINAFVKNAEGEYSSKFERVFGEAPEFDDGTALGRGFDRGVQQSKSLLGTTIETIGEKAGIGAIDRFGEGLEESARQELGALRIAHPDPTRWQDVQGLGSGLTFLGELAGEQVPQLGASLGAAGAATLLAPAGAIVAPIAAGALVSAPLLFGGNVQRQEEQVAAGEKESVDLGDALLSTFGQSALEGVASKLLITGLFKPAGGSIGGAKGLFVRTGSRAAGGATTEGLTEIGQSMLERAQAGLAIDDEDAIKEYIDAGIAGGVLGGAARAPGFGESGRTPTPKEEPAVETPTAPTIEPLPQPDQVAEVSEAAPVVLEGQGELFTGDNLGTTPADPLILTPEERTGRQLDLDIPAPPARADQQLEMSLNATVGTQGELFNSGDLRTQEGLFGGTAPITAPESQVEPSTVEPTPVEPATIDNDLLNELGVSRQAPVRKKIMGKTLAEPEVQAELRKYANNTYVRKNKPDLPARVEALLGTQDAQDTTGPSGAGIGVEDGGRSLEPSGRTLDRDADTAETIAPDARGLGRRVQDTAPAAAPVSDEPATITLYRAQRSEGGGDGVGEAAFGIGKYWSQDRGVAEKFKDVVPPVSLTGPNGKSVELNRRDALNDMRKLNSALREVGLSARDRPNIVRAIAGESTTLPKDTSIAVGSSDIVESQIDPSKFVQQTEKGKYRNFDLNKSEDVQALKDSGVEGTFYTDGEVTNFVQFPENIRNDQGVAKELQEFMDKYQLAATPVDTPIDTATVSALMNGDLSGALRGISTNSTDKTLKKMANRFADLVGDTRVEVVGSIDGSNGVDAAGMFNPETNTIQINRNTGMNGHTVMHEMAHALTAASLANRSLPTTAQLRVIWDNVRGQIGEVYGTRNLDEFVAEAMGNPQFQAMLAQTKVDSTGMNPWNKFTNAVRQIIRRALGKDMGNLAETNRIIDSILAPAPQYRSAAPMYLNTSPKEAIATLKSLVKPRAGTSDKWYDMTRDFIASNAPDMVKRAGLKSLRVGNLVRLAEDKIPFAKDLLDAIENLKGAYDKLALVNSAMVNDMAKFRREDRQGHDLLRSIMHDDTLEQVDSSLDGNPYSKFWLAYADTNTGEIKRSSYPTEGARAAAMVKLNTDFQSKGRTAAYASESPSPEKSDYYIKARARFKNLSPEGQRLYNQTRNYYASLQKRMVSSLMERMGQDITEGSARRRAIDKLLDILVRQSGHITPYFPLTREGGFRLQYTASDPRTGNVETFTTYHASDRKMRAAANRVQAYNESRGQGDLNSEMSMGKRSRDYSYEGGPDGSFVKDFLTEIDGAGIKDPALKTKLVDMVLDAMPERSLVHNMRRRKNVRGALGDISPDALSDGSLDSDLEIDIDTNLASTIRRTGLNLGRQIVQLEGSGALQEFQRKLNSSPDESGLSYKESMDTNLIANVMDEMAQFAKNPQVNSVSQAINSLAFAATMGLSPASAMLPVFDTIMASGYLGGEYGMGSTIRAMGDASRALAASPTFRSIEVDGADGVEMRDVDFGRFGKSVANYDFNDPNLPQNIRDLDTLYEELTLRGQLAASVTQEALEIDGTSAAMERLNKYSGALMHYSERYNREVLAVAAYNLELKKIMAGSDSVPTLAHKKKASDKALEAVEVNLGTLAAAGRPVYAQNAFGNVVFMYKNFAINKYHMMSSMVDKAFKDSPPAERAMARKQLLQFLLVNGLVTGASGMPMMGAIGMIYNLFRDDGEDDFESATRKLLGEGLYSGPINYITGADVASRTSLNSMLYQPPIIDKDQSPIWTLAEQIGGPAIGTANNVLRGVGLMNDGEVWRGMEAAAPTAVRNLMKAGRFGTEGALTRRDDAVVEDLNGYNIAVQALGFSPAAYIQQLEVNRNERRKYDGIRSKRTSLTRKYNMARRAGDADGAREALEDIQEWNRNLPPLYRGQALTRDALKKSNVGFKNTTKKMRGGIVYSPEMIKSAEEFNQGFQLFK